MSKTTRTFQISSEIFWGYRATLDLLYFENIENIIEYVKNDLKQFLLSRNLQLLVEKLDKTKFHIHSPYNTYSDILDKTDVSYVIYICDHCEYTIE